MLPEFDGESDFPPMPPVPLSLPSVVAGRSLRMAGALRSHRAVHLGQDDTTTRMSCRVAISTLCLRFKLKLNFISLGTRPQVASIDDRSIQDLGGHESAEPLLKRAL